MKYPLLLFILFASISVCFFSCSNAEETTTEPNINSLLTESSSETTAESLTQSAIQNNILVYEENICLGPVSVSFRPKLTGEEIKEIAVLMPESYDKEYSFTELEADPYVISVSGKSSPRWEFYLSGNNCYVKNSDGNFGITDNSIYLLLENIYYSKFHEETIS